MKKIFVFGNEDLAQDSLPLQLLPELKKRFPDIQFEVKDPNEEWDVPEDLVIIDTAIGIEKVTVFDSLEKFAETPRVSMHDFDALTNLRFLKKLGRIKEVEIIAVPAPSESNGSPDLNKKTALADISDNVVRLSR